ncbi:MAG: N-6 DNA methylase [Methylococcales bacterium]
MNFIKNETEQKLRGGYYTPLDLAIYVTQWALQNEPKQILEPSCGDGVFFEAISKLSLTHNMQATAFELLESEANKAKEKCKINPCLKSKIHTTDFLQWSIPRIQKKQTLFDAVIGNPPFIRYQYLSKEAQVKAEAIFDLLNLKFTKHTNAWVPFVLSSLALLKEGGRLAMVLPAEIIHVLHAQSLRTFLGDECSKLLIIDPAEIWFEGTLQGAVILLAEKKCKKHQHSEGVGIIRVQGRDFLQECSSSIFNNVDRINGKTVEGKWTPALLTSIERDIIDNVRTLDNVHAFNAIAKVDVGIVTGANNFFLVSNDVVKNNGLEQWAHPMFGRSNHCPGLIYDDKQHSSNEETGLPTNFIWLRDLEGLKISSKVKKYIKRGEENKLHTRYKCRIRKPWYTVPSVYSTNVGMLKRAHHAPKLIFNKIEAYTTDTAYRITTQEKNPKKLVYSFLNSLTALSAELEGRHYGGGVLELVPSEIEKLIVPLPNNIRINLSRIDKLIRTCGMEEVLFEQNKCILKNVGLLGNEQDVIFSAWNRLRKRRQREIVA